MSSSAPARISPQSKVYDLLVIDDDPLAIQLVEDVLEDDRFRIYGATAAESGLELFARHQHPVVLLDLVLPGVAGMEMLDRILAIDPSTDVILVTGNHSTDAVVEAIRRGAYDYLEKPLPVERLRNKLANWMIEAPAHPRIAGLEGELHNTGPFRRIVGRSPAMADVLSKIRRIAPHFQTALITGESGTGKESVAMALHQLSPDADGPFVVCNCAAIPENLFESELFGHVRGAFTGANQDKRGFAEAASGGTLFLDEITEVPLSTQAKLLRLLQNREIQPVGASRPKQVDVRIVAATNRDMRKLIAENKLREDLFYRLSMVELRLPRLVDRKGDLALLQRHFLERFAAQFRKPALSLSRRVQAVLERHSWPGNIRELENVLGYVAMVAESETIELRDLPDYLRTVEVCPPDEEVQVSMRSIELWHLRRVLEQVDGNRVRAAEILDISRTTLWRLLKEDQQEQLMRPGRVKGA